MDMQRRDMILRHVRLVGQMSVAEGVALLGVSAITVRRDFRQLAEDGLLRRMRGGVRLPELKGLLPTSMREAEQGSVKAMLARAAATRLQPHDVVIIDGGTTTYHLHACLPRIPLKIITNSLPLAVALEESRGSEAWPEIHLTGGVSYPHSGVLVGPGARRALSEYHARWTFLSVGGISEDGISNTTELVADVEREMIRRAETVVVLADSTKVGKNALYRVCGLEEIDVLITDASPAHKGLRQSIRDRDVSVEEAV